ncbi:dTMP kinase, partial [Streptococcus pyogenes]|uniref:dTMP kinase n=1 Tax=Streptococcus pyogenes TaxID=1314 RepID=UPI00125969E6
LETIEIHQRVRKGYLALAKEHPKRIVTIDANKPLKEVVSVALEHVLALLLA